MKWLSLLLISACAGEPFQGSYSIYHSDAGTASNGGQVPPDASPDVGGSNSTMVTANDAGMTGDGGEVGSGVSGDGGTGGTSESNGLAGAPSALPSCVDLPVWSVNCDFGEPTEYLRHGENLYRAPAMPSDCDGNCPPFGAKEDYCSITDYVYELIGPC
jgi:hypothetical protein